MADNIKRDAAFKALTFIYPDLVINKSSITPQAATFAFKVVYKVDKGTRLSTALFKISNPLYTKWTDLPIALAKAVYEYFKKADEFLKNELSSAFIAKQHRRGIKQHLLMPDVYPCPDFKK